MNIRLIAIVPGLIALSNGIAQVTVDWNQPTRGLSIALDQTNNVYTVDYEYALGGDISLTKRTSAGAFLWASGYNQTSTTMFDKATWVATDQLGNAIVSGTLMSGYSNPVNANSIVMKFGPTGTLLWRQVYETPFDGSWTVKCVADKANNIYVLGVGTGPNGQRTTVKKFSPGGVAQWAWFDPVGIGAPVNIKFTPDSNLVISARATSGNLNGYAKIDRNGNGIWSLAGVSSLTVGDAAGDAAGNTYCVSGGGAGTSTIRKLSPTGSLLWQNATYAVTAFRVEVGADQSPVICGFPASGGAGSAFMKVNPSGAVLWANADADGPNAFLLHAQMMMDAYNNAYLCAGTLFAMGICKVNSDGTTGWYVTTAGSNSNAFALGTDHNVYVVGGATARLGQNTPASVRISPKVLLEGPFQSGTGLMVDGLRSAALVPTTDPYAATGYIHTGGATPPTTIAVLATTGANAIVDWVLLELRPAADNSVVAASRSALVQRDGDVVDIDGASPIPFTAPVGSYSVVVKHRNHLGCMTATPIALSGTPVAIDFTVGSTATFGTEARKAIGNWRVLWAGDVTFNGQVKYTGVDNDRDPVLVRIGGVVATNAVDGYFPEDVNLNGQVKYTGTGNDLYPILQTIGGGAATNVRYEQVP